MPLADGRTFAGYRIVRPLGSGGMGEVYLAEHPRLPRQDAVKILPPEVSSDAEFRARFEREADLAASLWHPHIVSVHDRGEFNGQLWISMDFVDGTDAARLLSQRFSDGMPLDDVIAVVKAIGSALDYAHSRNLLHRDVKPANIILAHPTSDDRRILLTDFGIARDVNDMSGLTATNMAVGTVAYCAPEQLMGLGIDGRADQYALAATAYHLLTGNHPYPHSNHAVVITHHLNAEPPKVSNVRPDLAPIDQILAIAMAKSPDDRYPKCLDFARALEQAAFTANADPHSARTMLAPAAAATIPPFNAAPTVTGLSRGSHRQSKSYGRTRWIAMAGVAVTALLATAVMITWQPWRADDKVSAIATSTPSAGVPTPEGGQPRTLEAATLAGQEWADRRFDDDFAGIWSLYERRLRERITQADFVAYSEACEQTGSPLSFTVTGVRMDGGDRAIIRMAAVGGSVVRTMTYEDGSWKIATDDPVWIENLGLPLDQLITAEKARGDCNK